MKWIAAVLVTLCAITLYFIAINDTPFAWFPIALTVTLLYYLNAGPAMGFAVAVLAGFMSDMHFLYLGPASIILVVVIVTLHAVRGLFSTPDSATATGVLIVAGSTEYFLLTSAWSGVVNGWERVMPLLPFASTVIIFIAASSLVAAILHGIVASVRTAIHPEP